MVQVGVRFSHRVRILNIRIMTMVMWILLVLWIIGIPISYKWFISKWNQSKGEKIYFSIIWPLLLPLYVIHLIHKYLQ